jgi:hypothetical protein
MDLSKMDDGWGSRRRRLARHTATVHSQGRTARRCAGTIADASKPTGLLGSAARERTAANSAPVILNARRAKACKAMLVDGALPGQELVHGELVALTRFLEAEEAPADGGDNLGFTPDNPSLRVPWGKVRDSQGTAIGANHIACARSELLIGHDTRYTLSDLEPHYLDAINSL